jgi:hypothetical protein
LAKKKKYRRAIFRILTPKTPKIKEGKVWNYVANLMYEVFAGISVKVWKR